MFNLFKKKTQVILNDPIFGLIELDSSQGIDLWTHIPTDVVSHMICIAAAPSGPLASQREFYTRLQKSISSLESECKAFISQCENKPKNLRELTIYAINIGLDEELEKGQFEIELSDEDAFEIHRVIFKNMKPIDYEVDD